MSGPSLDTSHRFEPIKRRRMHELVYAQIEDRILRGDLPAGSRLPSVQELMADFGASRASVREALGVAEVMGLLEVRHGDPSGPIVTAEPARAVSRILRALVATDIGSLADLVELRMVLEGAAVFLAATRGSGLESVGGALEAMEVASDDVEFAHADVLFHFRVAEAGGNPLLALLTTALEDPMRAAVKAAMEETDVKREREMSIARHRAVLEAMLAGKAALARYRSHLGKLANFHNLLDAADRQRLRQLAESEAVDGESSSLDHWKCR